MTPKIFSNATVITLDPERPRATGLRIDGGRITHVFDGEIPLDLEGERIDLGGAVVLPGLVDAHFHLRGLGQSARQLDFRGTRSVDEITRTVRNAVAVAQAGTWIRGRGWDQNDWADKKFPTHAALDAVAPNHPVWLSRIDGHAVWLNARAMRLTGITAETKDPPGGEILRDASGRATGIFVDNAIDLVDGLLPKPTPVELREDLLAAQALCVRVGLTGVHDMGTTPAELDQLRALAREGRLKLRVTVYLDGQVDDLASLLTSPPERQGLLTVIGVKMYADGALGSRGAALLAPYEDRADTSGLMLTSPETLTAKARAVHDAGYQLAIHAIGDRGVRVALDAIAVAQREGRDRRHRVEHVQVVAPEDFERFASLGVIASLQPTHATSDMPWAEARLGPERVRGAYAWRRLLDAHAALAFGSDAPVEEENPWLGIYAAVTRQDARGEPKGGWMPQERLTVLETISAFTRGAAFAAGQSNLGVIRPGAVADLTVVDRDPEAVPPSELLTMHTLRTMVGGREVFAGGGAASPQP
ncbi:MAG: amidohydrolase [Myxococcota bacterium]